MCHISFVAGSFAAGVAQAWQRPAVYTGRKFNSAGSVTDGDGVKYDILDQGKDNIRPIADKGDGPVYAQSMVLYDGYTCKLYHNDNLIQPWVHEYRGGSLMGEYKGGSEVIFGPSDRAAFYECWSATATTFERHEIVGTVSIVHRTNNTYRRDPIYLTGIKSYGRLKPDPDEWKVDWVEIRASAACAFYTEDDWFSAKLPGPLEPKKLANDGIASTHGDANKYKCWHTNRPSLAPEAPASWKGESCGYAYNGTGTINRLLESYVGELWPDSDANPCALNWVKTKYNGAPAYHVFSGCTCAYLGAGPGGEKVILKQVMGEDKGGFRDLPAHHLPIWGYKCWR